MSLDYLARRDSLDDSSGLRLGIPAGRVHLPGDAAYDAARLPWNVAVDQRPAAVAYPHSAEEVSALVRAAGDAGLRVAPQSTGHNAGPLAARGLDDVVVVRTSDMNLVIADPDAEIVKGYQKGTMSAAISSFGLGDKPQDVAALVAFIETQR